MIPWRVARSPIHGRGVQVLRAAPAGTVVGMSHWHDGREWHCTQLGAFHNHSRRPTATNVHLGDRRFLVTTRDVCAGEEITVDYRLQPDLEQPGANWR